MERAGKCRRWGRTAKTVGEVTVEAQVRAEDTMAQGPLLDVRVKPVPVCTFVSFDSWAMV